jgi:YidC/Oxa1 family membrane protein insertase
MKKNTVIGILLMGLILIGFSIYNSKQFKKQQEIQRVQDSIALERQLKYANEIAAIKADSIAAAASQTDVNQPKSQYSYIYKDSLLESSHKSEAEYFTLENSKIKALFTTRGAQAYKVQIKNYYTYDSLDLILMKEDASHFGIQFYTSQMLDTKNFTFKKVENTDSTLKMRLYFSDNAYIEHSYFLAAESYMIDFKLNMVNMQSFIPKSVTHLDLSWDMNVPRLEKGYDNEKNYSAVDYKYPNDKEIENLGQRKDSGKKNITTKLSWFAYQQQFFSAILLADNCFTSGDLSFSVFPENDSSSNLMACSSKMQFEYSGGDNVSIPFKFYYGPNLYKTLKSYDYGFEKIVPLGGWLIRWINRLVIIPVFDLFSKFIASYGIIILLMTILLKLVISPLTIKSYMSSAKMRVLKPEIDKINAKYPKQEDAMKKQQETMDLYKKSGVSMFGGCLPMLLQFPLLFAMFRFFPASFELRQQGFLWVQDLSTYDSILDLPFRIPLYGDHISLFAILSSLTMFVYSRMTYKDMGSSQQMAGMKFMTLYFMPIFMLFICNNLSSALCYYYFLSNIFMMLQTWIIRKYFVDEEKIFAKLKENSAKAKTKPKSKFQQRLEAAAKAQQEAMRQQQKRR